MNAECVTCRCNRGELLSPGGVIYQDSMWRLEHTFFPVPMAGWVILKPLRHVEHLADLTAEELTSYGPLSGRIAAGLREVLQATKVYMVLFAESANAPHLHIHFIPRSADLPPEYRGPEVFRLLGMAERDGFSGAEYSYVERVVNDLRDALNPIQSRVWNQE